MNQAFLLARIPRYDGIGVTMKIAYFTTGQVPAYDSVVIETNETPEAAVYRKGGERAKFVRLFTSAADVEAQLAQDTDLEGDAIGKARRF
jgi:hypothetical protein